MDLDRHKLEEERRWRHKNYTDQVRRLVTTLVDAIQTEAKRVLEREIAYDDDARHEYSYVDQAGQLQHAILQAINNADFGGLTRDAGDLHAVMMGLHTLAKLKDALPSTVRAELESGEDDGLRARIDKKLARIDELDARDANGCMVAVHESGRGVGFHRCTFEGKQTITVDEHGKVLPADDPKAEEIKVCTRHANDAKKRGSIHRYRPWNKWETQQSLAHREKERREIAAMQAQLGELSTGERQKELEA